MVPTYGSTPMWVTRYAIAVIDPYYGYQNINRRMLMFCRIPIPTIEVTIEVPP